jgi:hypothetical protein
MPAISTKQFKVITPAGSNAPTTCVAASPALPGRTLLLIQNTGANPGLIHFKEGVQGDGSDIAVAAGAFAPLFDHATTCPREKVNLGSASATTWAVLEQVQQ